MTYLVITMVALFINMVALVIAVTRCAAHDNAQRICIGSFGLLTFIIALLSLLAFAGDSAEYHYLCWGLELSVFILFATQIVTKGVHAPHPVSSVAAAARARLRNKGAFKPGRDR